MSLISLPGKGGEVHLKNRQSETAPAKNVTAKDDAAEKEAGVTVDAHRPSNAFYLDEYIATSVGTQFRNERRRKARTLQDIAGAAHVSVALLSKIEHGKLSPSLRTLGRLARVMDMPITAFFRGLEEEHDASFVAAGEGPVLMRPGGKSGHRYELLASPIGPHRGIEPTLVTLPAGDETFPLYQRQRGVEFIHVLGGRMKFRFGADLYDMKPGDSLMFDTIVPHGPEKLIEPPVRFLSVVVDPRYGQE